MHLPTVDDNLFHIDRYGCYTASHRLPYTHVYVARCLPAEGEKHWGRLLVCLFPVALIVWRRNKSEALQFSTCTWMGQSLNKKQCVVVVDDNVYGDEDDWCLSFLACLLACLPMDTVSSGEDVAVTDDGPPAEDEVVEFLSQTRHPRELVHVGGLSSHDPLAEPQPALCMKAQQGTFFCVYS